MCIIVAKNPGNKMPNESILSNCFTNNPDGAGIMIGAKGRVYGFKGLMTYDAFKAKLKQLEKRFGSLDKLPVVMHFRITTHGGTIAANTHPFPVSQSYKSLRKLEWVSNLGVAHNGIIDATSLHPDVKRENVSDTMVFIKRVIAPISANASIMRNSKLQEAISLASGSKLAFMDSENIVVLGNFTYSDGVYYSNTSYEKARFSYKYYNYDYGWSDYDDYEYTHGWKGTKTKRARDDSDFIPKLSADDERYLRNTTAFEYGLTVLGKTRIQCDGYQVPASYIEYAVDDSDGALYYWDSEKYDWFPSCYSDEAIEYFPEDWETVDAGMAE